MSLKKLPVICKIKSLKIYVCYPKIKFPDGIIHGKPTIIFVVNWQRPELFTDTNYRIGFPDSIFLTPLIVPFYLSKFDPNCFSSSSIYAFDKEGTRL